MEEEDDSEVRDPPSGSSARLQIESLGLIGRQTTGRELDVERRENMPKIVVSEFLTLDG